MVFEKPLKAQATQREQIQVACPQADEATCTYAAQFIDLFREAGWKVAPNEVERITMAKPILGVVLFRRGTGQLNPNDWRSGLWVKMSPSVISVYHAFADVGIEADFEANAAIPANSITVYFGLEKPNPREPTPLTNAIESMDKEIREGRLPNAQ